MPKLVLSEYDKLVWPFLWGSTIETVSSQQCHNPAGDSGLNGTDTKLKARALQAVTMVQTLETPTHKSLHLAKYNAGQHIARLNPRWLHLRTNNHPNALAPDTIYATSLATVAEIVAGISDPTNLSFSTKNCYTMLRDPATQRSGETLSATLHIHTVCWADNLK